MNVTDTQTAKTPTHIAYQVREGSKQHYWTRIGAAWPHKDGKGFTVQLECMPLDSDGRVCLRDISDDK